MRVDQLPGWSNHTNPYNALLCDALGRAGCEVRDYSLKSLMTGPAPGVVHVHWPEYGLSQPSVGRARLVLTKLFFGMRIARARGAKIVWTAHNLRPHERMHPALESWFYRKWLSTVDGVICLSEVARRAVVDRYPAVATLRSAVIRHGDYRPRLTGAFVQETARESLGIAKNARVIASVGAIREYKNIPALVRAFRSSAQLADVLLIAGKPAPAALEAEIREVVGGDDRVLCEFSFLSDARMEELTVASDWLVFPYRDILNSGSALFALSCGRPILAPRIGSLPELQSDVGAEWVRLYDGDFGADALSELVAPPSGEPDVSLYDWDEIGRATREFYVEVGGRG